MRHFRLQVLVRVTLIAATLLMALVLLTETQAFVAASVVAMAAVAQVVGLIRFVERTNRDVARFLSAIRYEDFAQSFGGERFGASFGELHEAFKQVMDDFRQTRTEKEEHYRYLQTVMQHVGVGLVSFREDGSVGLVNNAAKRLLRVPRLKHLDALRAWSNDLVETLMRLRSGEKALVKVRDEDEWLELVMHATEFKLGGEGFTLVSIQDIQPELEEKEIEAWQKLTRVLTHEIMNSITPIASLAATAQELIEEEESDPEEAREDLRSAVRTIERRSQNLLGFVGAYRRLTRIPRPDFRIIPVAGLFGNVADLFALQLREQGITLQRHLDPPSLDLTCDPDLVEQVLINLVKNALEALGTQPDGKIRLEASLDRGRVVLRVADNGPGIEEEALEKLFIPFFTTKPEGSGIGLSLSRQIMRAHGGTLSVRTAPGIETVFTLRF